MLFFGSHSQAALCLCGLGVEIMLLKVGDPAPNFQLPLLQAGDSSVQECQSLSDLLAQGPVLLMFVKAGCPTCQLALPLIDRIYRNYPDAHTSVVVVAQEGQPVAAQMVRDLWLHMAVLLDDAPYSVSSEYGLAYVPTFFYVEQDSKIRQVVESFARADLQTINERIARANDKLPVPFFSPEEDVPEFRPG
jgi:peroxiredoxin